MIVRIGWCHLLVHNLKAIQFVRIPVNRDANLFKSRVWHSHMICTLQPALRNFRCARLSRFIFSSNLFSQNWVRVLGVVTNAQFLCLCQKQPCTKKMVWCFGNDKSGEPGSFELCKRNR